MNAIARSKQPSAPTGRPIPPQWCAIVLAASLVAVSGPASAQGVYLQLGAGAGILEIAGRTVAHPAATLAIGYQAASPFTVRVDGRLVGNTNSVIIGPALGIGYSGRFGRVPVGYLLGSGGNVLSSEGDWASTFGFIAGAGGGRRTPLFSELRFDAMSGSDGRGQRGSAVLSLVAGARVGATPRGR